MQGDPVLVGAGDIADCARSGDTATANLVASIPGTVWTAGDNVYQNGLLSEFNNCYDPTWGAVKSRTRPTPGNHDYGNGSNDGSGYFDYFNGAGNFTTRVRIGAGWNGFTHRVGVGDVTGDGRLDLVGYGPNGAAVYRASGSTTTPVAAQATNLYAGEGTMFDSVA